LPVGIGGMPAVSPLHPLSLRQECLLAPLGPLLILCDEQQRLRGVDWLDHEARLMQLLARQYRPAEVAVQPSDPARPTPAYAALPLAMRVTGLANGANPISIVRPCHRVIGSDGSLTGYGGGLPRRRWLLAHEAHEAHEARRSPA
jgi:methylated-DNA-[protein]-cysteine S-methyltransferase